MVPRSRSGWAAAVLLVVTLGASARASAGQCRSPQEPPAATPTPPPASTSAATPEGFVIEPAPEFRLRVTGYAQADGRFFIGDDGGTAVDTFLVRRARPIVQGTLGRAFEFNIT